MELILSDGTKALVSPEDYEQVSKHKWWLGATGKYVMGRPYGSATNPVYLHRYLVEAPKGYVIDHINRNKLDNRRTNLRVCNHSVNHFNVNPPRSNRSGVVGVNWHKASGKWRAFIGKQHLGLFTSLEEAARFRQESLDKYLG